MHYVLFLWRYNFHSLCSFKFDMKIYSYNNTCLLSVYGGPTWDMLCGTKDSEERDKFLWCYKHVIVCCSIKEKPKHRIVPAPVKMEPGSAYLVFTIGGFKAGTFKKVAWIMQDVIHLDKPFPLGKGEKPIRGPTRLNPDKPGHVELLALLNSTKSTGSV